MAMRFREAFDETRSFVVRRDLRLSGQPVAVGGEFPKEAVTPQRLRQLFNQRAIAYPDETGVEMARAPAPARWRPTLVSAPPAPVSTADPNRLGAHVPIPEDWRALRWPRLLHLASYFKAERVMTKAEAIALIEAELQSRGLA